ncbi:MAG: HlyD family efflux transporter periplasmic adaptor subunit [Granulosicoccus sp.]
MIGATQQQAQPSEDSQASAVSPETAALHARAMRAEALAVHQSVLIGMLAELLSCTSLEIALDALAGALKARFSCDRVAIALYNNDDLQLCTVSQQAVLQSSSSEARLLVDTMREACVLESVVCWPSSSDRFGVLIAHRTLAGRRLNESICSVPLYANQELVGAFLLERRDQRVFPVATLERLSTALAPLILLHKQVDRHWWTVLRQQMGRQIGRFLGNDRPGVRLLWALASICLVASLTMTTRLQIVAPAELLSHERHVVTAPQTGFVSDIQVVAGDQVMAGQLIARLDQREMELEASSRESDIVMADAEFRAAMASYDHQATGIARARLAQARARLDAVERRLNRSDLLSPIDGIVIAADVTRTAGSPVTRGETLFEIAPDADFEVHVLVNEVDVYDIFVGQTGMLALRARPQDTLPVIVKSVHPVAEARDGMNRFRVRANLIDPVASLRPGQSGVVRLDGVRMSFFAALFRPLNRRLAELWWRLVG